MVGEAGPTNQYFLQGHRGEAQNYSLTGRAAVIHHCSHRRPLPGPHCRGDPILFSTANEKEPTLACFCLFVTQLHKQNNIKRGNRFMEPQGGKVQRDVPPRVLDVSLGHTWTAGDGLCPCIQGFYTHRPSSSFQEKVTGGQIRKPWHHW